MQRLAPGAFGASVSQDVEIWLDGGHNPAAGRVLAQAFSELNDRHSRPLILIWGMLDTKDAAAFIAAFTGVAFQVFAVTIPGERHAVPAETLAEVARRNGHVAAAAMSVDHALEAAGRMKPPPRILICGSLYLAGTVLAAHKGI